MNSKPMLIAVCSALILFIAILYLTKSIFIGIIAELIYIVLYLIITRILKSRKASSNASN